MGTRSKDSDFVGFVFLVLSLFGSYGIVRLWLLLEKSSEDGSTKGAGKEA